MAVRTKLPNEIRNKIIGENIVDKDKLGDYLNKFMTTFVDKEDIPNQSKLLIHLDKYPDKKWPKTVRQKHKKLTQSERRKLGLYSIGRKSLKYDDLLPLHALWNDYMRAYLKLEQLRKEGQINRFADNSFEQVGVKLFRADYHGAELFIKRSVCPSYIGRSGIVAMETKNCFLLLGKDNEFQRRLANLHLRWITLNFLSWAKTALADRLKEAQRK